MPFSGEWSQATCLPELLTAAVSAHPDRIAVSDGHDSLTFRQLLARSQELAAFLTSEGVTAEQPVGVFMEPSVELMVSVWGVLFAGAAYLPLSPEYPDERLRYMLADAAVPVVLAGDDLTSRVRRLLTHASTVVTPAQALGSGLGSRDGHCLPSDLAYVIYTSGSTGAPKGILIEHRSIVSQLRWLAETHGVDERRTVLQKTPLSFDAAQWEILAPASGSHVVMADSGAYRDPERLLDLVIGHHVTTLQGVPTLLQALVDTDRLTDCGSLLQVFSGGEALTKALAIDLLDRLPGRELVNLYGPSECTINTSSYVVDRAAVADGPDIVPIGRPVRDTSYSILDPNGRPVAGTDTGELHVAGVQLARGYLNKDDLTRERFVPNPTPSGPLTTRLYRTGDLARWNADGTAQFVGRVDSQVKLRGFRVELDEIRAAIESHSWVKRAAVVVRQDPRTGANLIAVAELNANEAALMDQGNHGEHHQSKRNKLQTRAQLSNAGCRDAADLAGRPSLVLPGHAASDAVRRMVFARKTYRFFEGAQVSRAQLMELLSSRAPATRPSALDELTFAELGSVLRAFGQFSSDERLLPKYGYASPGSLYATQLYVEICGVADVPPGHYYYHPVEHRLVLVAGVSSEARRLRVHLVGRRSAIEPVYRNNIQEVLQIEAGHLLGLMDAVLPAHGYCVRSGATVAGLTAVLGCAAEDYDLGSFDVLPDDGAEAADANPDGAVEVFVQSHPDRVADLSAGLYRYTGSDLELVSDEQILKRHVIAINQAVYERASFGISLTCAEVDPWARYVAVGRALQRLQMNDLGIGLMSSGYSSRTGNELPAARRLREILGHPEDVATYFAVGGGVSEEQRLSEGMKEDVVHMRGPAEILKEDLAQRLPHYMVPNRVHLVDALPLTVNGKVDVKALQELDALRSQARDLPLVAPRTPVEVTIAGHWCHVLKQSTASVLDDFFYSGGNSLASVGLLSRIGRSFGTTLPLQTVFEFPTIELLAQRVERALRSDGGHGTSRLVRLRAESSGVPVFCWPGLGGYPMNLRRLAERVAAGRPFLGVQAHGINVGEDPYPTIGDMAANDLDLIKRRQPRGPYTLWGYSFGARVAFETAYRLEQGGDEVADLVLIAPGQPHVEGAERSQASGRPSFDNPTFVAILFSVFAGGLHHPAAAECLRRATDEPSFVAFVLEKYPHLDDELVRRIVTVVRCTFGFEYGDADYGRRRLRAPVTVVTASGDDPSFIERDSLATAQPLRLIGVHADHYGLLRPAGLEELAHALTVAESPTKDNAMPHVTIKHMPATLAPEQLQMLINGITSAVEQAFACDPGAVSIALESVTRDVWDERVYIPEIVNRKESLVKVPNY